MLASGPTLGGDEPKTTFDKVRTLINERIFRPREKFIANPTIDNLYVLYKQYKPRGFKADAFAKESKYVVSGPISYNEMEKPSYYFTKKMSEAINILKQIKPTSILDIGSSDGKTVSQLIYAYLGKSTTFPKLYLYDIKPPVVMYNVKEFNTEYIIGTPGKSINTSAENIEACTCFQVFHHMNDDDAKILIGDIYRVMKTDAYLIITDHNCTSPDDIYVARMQHILYDMQTLQPGMSADEFAEFINTYDKTSPTTYRSADRLNSMIELAGFKLQAMVFNPADNPARVYQAVFKK
jgi:SAM-dependent methyltransferase